MVTFATLGDYHSVYLQLANRDPDDDDSTIYTTEDTDTIGLKAETIGIATTRNVPSFPIPFSGVIRGESTNLALDTGMATKSINITGQIFEQTLKKIVDGKEGTTVLMTPHEIAQLIHSYVDSSGAQPSQNINRLFIRIPSRVGPSWTYHTSPSVSASTAIEDCPLIPFNFATRNEESSEVLAGASTFPDPSDSTTLKNGMTGFIRSFNCDLSGENFPAIGFTLDFEVAIMVGL